MLDFIVELNFSFLQWIALAFSGIVVGITKTGIAGATIITVPILAGMFGAKMSTGLLLPLLSFGDVLGVGYYHQHAQWKYVWRLLPWTIVGILLGVLFGAVISDAVFKYSIAIFVLACLGIMVWREFFARDFHVPTAPWFGAVMGVLAGFSTMIGNASGPIMAVYLLSMGLEKNTYIGTNAWFFLIVNLVKMPFHIFVWKTITLHSFCFNLLLIPAILVGAVIGIAVVKLLPEKPFRLLIIGISTVAVVRLLF
jgi:uncharacterized protein